MVLSLWNSSATWFIRFHFKSSAMDTWYLVSLGTYSNWPRFLQNFLVSSSLLQLQVKPSRNVCELKWLRLWPKSRVFKFWKKNLIVLPSLWSDKMDIETIEVFRNSFLEVLTKEVVPFGRWRHWKITNANRRLQIDFF